MQHCGCLQEVTEKTLFHDKDCPSVFAARCCISSISLWWGVHSALWPSVRAAASESVTQKNPKTNKLIKKAGGLLRSPRMWVHKKECSKSRWTLWKVLNILYITVHKQCGVFNLFSLVSSGFSQLPFTFLPTATAWYCFFLSYTVTL